MARQLQGADWSVPTGGAHQLWPRGMEVWGLHVAIQRREEMISGLWGAEKFPRVCLPQKGNLHFEAQQVLIEHKLFFDAVEGSMGLTVHGLSSEAY